jgi:hypothetical protein
MKKKAPEEQIDRYSITDFRVPWFPPAAAVYWQTEPFAEFKLFHSFGTLAAAHELADILCGYEGVDSFVVELTEIN